MDITNNDYWPYAVGLAMTLAIYFCMFTALPFLFQKLMRSTPIQKVVQSKAVQLPANKAIDAVTKIVKPKPEFSFEYREVTGEMAMAAFEAAKAEGKGIPVIIGGGENERLALADMMQHRNLTEFYLQKADANPNPFASKSKPRMPATWVDVGPFPDDGQPFLVKNYPEGFKPILTLAFIPAKTSADIPAYLKLGSWNGIPDADVYVALIRKWQRDYGAELVALRMDCLDIRVARKPEHLKFCATGSTIAETAAELMATNRWHFYWD
jgi:hypothetical protein